MFTIDSTIDAVQTAKKQWVKTFIQNEAVAKAMTDFVDAQSEYTKKAAKTGTETATVFVNEAVKTAQSMGKFDYAKFGEGIMKAYTDLNKTAAKASKKAE
jgi:hypothetical protein